MNQSDEESGAVSAAQWLSAWEAMKEDSELKASLGYVLRPCPKKPQMPTTQC